MNRRTFMTITGGVVGSLVVPSIASSGIPKSVKASDFKILKYNCEHEVGMFVVRYGDNTSFETIVPVYEDMNDENIEELVSNFREGLKNMDNTNNDLIYICHDINHKKYGLISSDRPIEKVREKKAIYKKIGGKFKSEWRVVDKILRRDAFGYYPNYHKKPT